MKRPKTTVVALFLLCCTASAFLAVPGIHRALIPGLFGLQQIERDIYIDDLTQATKAKKLVAAAEANSKAFFGTINATPRYILCTTPKCQRIFGLTGSGLTVAYHFVLVSPRGFNERVLTHERVHVDLHAFMGISDLWDQRFPAWFDEGLATLISQETRVWSFKDPKQAEWIKDMQSYRQWSRMILKTDWRRAYGAARQMVTELEASLKPGGLRLLVDQVAAGRPFDVTRRALLKDAS